MLKRASGLLAMALYCLLGQAIVCTAADEPSIKTGEKQDTLLYVRTVPSGAKIFLDGKELGASGGMFPVEPGVGSILIEFDGHKVGERQITIQANRVTRFELTLAPPEKPANATSQPVKREIPHMKKKGMGFVVLDLASGKMVRLPEAADSAHAAQTESTKVDEGDLAFDASDSIGDSRLVCLHGGKVEVWNDRPSDSRRPADLQSIAVDQIPNATAYRFPSLPCRLLITTAEKKRFDVRIVAVNRTADGGNLLLEYRIADAENLQQ